MGKMAQEEAARRATRAAEEEEIKRKGRIAVAYFAIAASLLIGGITIAEILNGSNPAEASGVAGVALGVLAVSSTAGYVLVRSWRPPGHEN
ncbi:MAG TPA: hypothetical protein VK424_02840 [Thermoplasmata archaeon]|nr:hypothetical protein [Thermoplasmata archaeon]